MPRRIAALVAVAGLVLAACGAGDDDAGDGGAGDAGSGGAGTGDDTTAVAPVDTDGEPSGAVRGDDPSGRAPGATPADDDAGDADGTGGAVPLAGPEPLEVDDAAFLPTVCPFEIEVDLEVECGVVEVPESRTGLSERTVELAVAIMRTPAPDPAPDPVVFLAGGPGGVALAEHFVWFGGTDDWSEHPVFAERDLVLVDQRGTGYSRPSLWCDDSSEDVEECHDRLVDDGIALAAYSTPENAADIATVRRALGVESWNLYGSSYGTRLALTVLRDHPRGIRSVVLEGAYPPDVVPAYHDYLPHTLRALGEVAEACAADERCAEAYGDVGQLLALALEVADTDPATGYDSVDLVDAVFGSLYGMDGVLDVPYALRLAADGDVDAAIDVLLGGGTEAGATSRPPRGTHRWAVDPTEDAAGVFNSIECREEHAFTDLAHLDRQIEMYRAAGIDERLLAALYDTVEYPIAAVCPSWDSGEAALAERAPARSDVPVLVLSGRFDPITPPAWGELATTHLRRSTHLVAPNLSHSLVLEDPCVDSVTATFLDEPEAPLDTSCTAGMTMPSFTLP